VEDKKLAGGLTVMELYDNQVEPGKNLNLAIFPENEEIVGTSSGQAGGSPD